MSPLAMFGTLWPYVPLVPVVYVRLVSLIVGVLIGLDASMAMAPAPVDIPKISSRALPNVTDCFGPRKRGRETTLPPAPGRNRYCPVADSFPALNSVSSVRQAEPPTPLVCAVTDTSDRYAVNGLTVIERVAELEETELKTVTLIVYVPGAA